MKTSMGNLITDLEAIARLAERDSKENYKFRGFLKFGLSWSDRKLDSAVHEIVRSVSAEIECTACANCCRTMEVAIESEDVEHLARRLGISTTEFEGRYVREGSFGEKQMSQTPCPFLDGCLCTVYEDRPKDCREFPHLDKRDIRSRSIGLVENATTCPIVFNALEELKRRVNWRRRG